MSDARLVGYYRWHARIYDATRWAFLFGRSELIQVAARQFSEPRRILEIGCGTGANLVALARQFPSAEIVGMDISPAMLAVARRKLQPLAPRVSLREGAYERPVSEGRPFDLIIFSYCLSMINPGYAEVLSRCRQDLQANGRIAIVDFHQSPWPWFERWMRINHVRMDGQILRELRTLGMAAESCAIRRGYGGVWEWLLCFASP